MTDTEQGTRYGNIGVLDLRHADADALRAIHSIGNVGLVLYGAGTRSLINLLSIGNVGDMVEIARHANLEMGAMRLDHETLSNRSAPISAIAMGEVVVAPDVTPADIEHGIERLVIMGSVVCPDNLVGALRPKIKRLMGTLTGYPAGCQLVSAPGSMELDANGVDALNDGTVLLVNGRLEVPEPLPAELLERKLTRIIGSGSVLCNEENAPLLRALMAGQPMRTTVVPSGFRLVNRALTIDDTFLRFSGADRLYCGRRVVVDAAVAAEEVDQHLRALRCSDRILAPIALRDALAPKCDLMQDRVTFYEGTLWLEDGETTLHAQRLASLDGVATLWVGGELTIAVDVAADMLAEKLAKVHNHGTILCTPAQMGALHLRMGDNQGELRDRTAPEEEPPDDGSRRIGNTGYLAV